MYGISGMQWYDFAVVHLLSTYLSAHLSIPTQVPIMSNESWMGGMAFIRFMLH